MEDSQLTSLESQSDTLLTSDDTDVNDINALGPVKDARPSEVVRLGLAKSIAEYMRSMMQNIRGDSAIVSSLKR